MRRYVFMQKSVTAALANVICCLYPTMMTFILSYSMMTGPNYISSRISWNVLENSRHDVIML